MRGGWGLGPRGARTSRALLAALAPLACAAGGKAGAGAPAPAGAGPRSLAGGATCSVARDYWPTNGWRASSPAAEGMDSVLLDSAASVIVRRHPNVYSVLVARHGHLVMERYFGGHDTASAFDLRSGTKSITSMLVGIAIGEKLLRGIDQPIADLVPEALVGDDVDPRKRRITLRHLLTMTSGLDWTEGEGVRYFAGQRNWASAILARPMAADPGRRFNYSSGNAHLLSTAVSRASGTSTLDRARPATAFSGGFATSTGTRRTWRWGTAGSTWWWCRSSISWW